MEEVIVKRTSRETAEINSKVCDTILEHKEVVSKRVNILKAQIALIELDFYTFKQQICTDNQVDYEFINTILSGRSAKEDLLEDVEDEIEDED